MSRSSTTLRTDRGLSGITAAQALAIGALATGAIAIGALAIGALAIGRLRILDGRIEKLSIGTLTVEHMNLLSQTPAKDERATKV